MINKLVIVESPTKAKTIRGFLPKGFRVMASMGHVRDLPQSAAEIPAKVKGEKWAQLGVNINKDFEPLYVIPKTKKKLVQELKDALKDSDELFLATDEDREGESISWHILETLAPKIPVKRMVFHEITREAIEDALKNCRDIDLKLVRAQETRRILDRLVGYTLSPLIWKKIAYGLSAGRVQSVAVDLTVKREKERHAFVRAGYWGLKAKLAKDQSAFESTLASIGGKKLASGKDFDENTGKLIAGHDVVLLNESQAKSLNQKLKTQKWSVSKVEEKPVTRSPSPPFITSTLQQEANRKLRLSAKDTMRTAQHLYENGFITYMRTDSVHLSSQAISAARSCVKEMYGEDYLSKTERQYKTKSKGAQEAHEAIRPAGNVFRTPKDTELSGRELALYDLIWKRTVATQMAECQQTLMTVRIQADDAEFTSSGKRIDFPGFFRAYVEGSDDPDAALEEQEVVLPRLKSGDAVDLKELLETEHETQPPARYTEASLIKVMENEGIGRPSTYATIIGTIVDRGYATLQGNTLIPTFTAFAVANLLEKYFCNLVDTGFTAKMETVLDDIAEGDMESLPYLKSFFLGASGFLSEVEKREGEIDPDEARTVGFADIDAKIRIGRYGAYLESVKDGEPVKANIPAFVAPADLNNEKIRELITLKTQGPQSLGIHPETGESIYILVGAYGPYVQLGEVSDEKPKPKRVSLFKGMKPDETTLEQALALLTLPRTLGLHPESGGKIQANLGRFGPYVMLDLGKDSKDYRSVKAPDDVTSITLERAVEILKEPKRGRGSRKTAEPLKTLGQHPDDNQTVAIYHGPYGHYVKHGKTNAGLPKETNIEDVTLAEALELLSKKQGGKGGKKSRKAAPGAAVKIRKRA